MKRYNVILIVLMFLCTSCGKNMINNLDLKISNQFLECINKYISEHPQYKSLTIITDLEYNWREGYKSNNSVFLIGPSFLQEYEDDSYPCISFEYMKRIVFIQSSCDMLHQHGNKEYYRTELSDEKTVLFYFKNAIAYQSCNNGQYRLVSTQPDTLLLHKTIKFIPPLVNE